MGFTFRGGWLLIYQPHTVDTLFQIIPANHITSLHEYPTLIGQVT
jgi:hypothetical protein